VGGRPSEGGLPGRKGHGMVWRENIDSGCPNFQLDTGPSGSRRNLDYLPIRRTLTPLTYSKGAGRQWCSNNLAPAEGVEKCWREAASV
jgi:hypothetical protein